MVCDAISMVSRDHVVTIHRDPTSVYPQCPLAKYQLEYVIHLFRFLVNRKTTTLRGLNTSFSQCTSAVCAPRSDFARPKDEASRLPPPPRRPPAATIKSGASVYKEAIAGNGEGEQEVGGGRVGGQASSRRRRGTKRGFFYEGGDDLLIYWCR